MHHLVFKIACSLAISVLSTSLSAAAGRQMNVKIHCPAIKSSGVNIVTHSGTYLEGMGTEKINNAEITPPVFKNNITPDSSIPSDLKAAGYHNSGVEYNPITGMVMCQYKTWRGHDSFALSSVKNHGVGGVVTRSNKDEIFISFSA
ncbi:MAG TPA: hypothetical protein DDY37_07785 [Legionella sp.]|nr:hypothetical protein [Legionella sp.]